MTQSPHRRRRRRRRHIRPWVIFLCAGLGLFLGLFEKPAQSPRVARTIRIVPDSFDFAAYHVPDTAKAESGRVIFPYSVIPGGVSDREELADAVDRDPVVAEHYANFKVEDAQIVRAQNPQSVYVSYRIQNKIFWTARKVKLTQGERLISDGQTLARTRCGNQVSAVPQEPVSAEEPPPEVFDTPVIPVDDLPLLSETIPAPSFSLTDETPLPVLESLVNPPDLVTLRDMYFDYWFVPPYVPITYFPPLYVVPESPIISEVPESGTLILLALGLAIPVFLRLRSRMASRRG